MSLFLDIVFHFHFTKPVALFSTMQWTTRHLNLEARYIFLAGLYQSTAGARDLDN
jgi:hypothetical protein